MASTSFQPNILAGQHAFITGGTSGINLGIGVRFAQAGAKVTVLGRKPEKAEAAAAALKAIQPDALAVLADVRDPKLLEAAFIAAKEKNGPIDILVCGAAGNFPAPALGMSTNAFKAVVDIDLLGTFNACRVGFEHMRVPGARVVNISAPQAGLPSILQTHVCAAKAGVDALTRSLALEWGPLGVRVTSIWPGAVEGTEGMERLAPDAAAREKMATAIPLQRFAQVDDIAELAMFLVSDSGRYCTGAVFTCDGGLSSAGWASLGLGG